MKRRVTELSGYKPLLRWMASIAVIIGGALVMPTVALADGGGTTNGNQSTPPPKNDKPPIQDPPPSVPETPYTILFPLAMVGLTVVAYRKRRSGTE